MQITLNVPDEFVRQVVPEGDDPARLALEALALEGYRAHRLTESGLRRMLGFESRMQVHAFLCQHDSYIHYDLEDLEKDRASSEAFLAKRRSGDAAAK